MTSRPVCVLMSLYSLGYSQSPIAEQSHVLCLSVGLFSFPPAPGKCDQLPSSLPSLQAERAHSLEHRSGMALLLGEKIYTAAIYNLYMNA